MVSKFNAEEHITFGGRDWISIKAWAAQQKETKLQMLISETSHDKSNVIRGYLAMLNDLLGLEKAAEIAAQRNHQ